MNRDVHSRSIIWHRHRFCGHSEAIGRYGAGEKEAGAVKEKMSFRAWERMMQEIPGFARVKQAVRLREEAEEKLRWADPDYREVAELEIQAAEERVRAEVRRAKNSRG